MSNRFQIVTGLNLDSSRLLAPLTRIALLALVVILLLASPEFALAAGGGEHGQQTLWDIRHFFFNFSLFVLILFFILRKPALRGWNERRESIKSLAEQGVRAREAAQARLAQAKQMLADVGRESAAIESRIKSEGEQEYAAILSHDRKECEAIVRQAHSSIEAEDRAMREQAATEFTATVLSRVREKIGSNVSRDLDSKLRASTLAGNGVQELLH